MKFLVGYDVPNGFEVEVELHHLFISGVTQLSGKTTSLEAFIHRVQPRRTLVFRCGRGEIGFDGATRIPPYFRHRTDWQYVEGLLAAQYHEKMRFYRGDIMRACHGAKTLGDVHRNIKKRLEKARKDSFVEKILMELDQYFTETLPVLESVKFSSDLKLADGMNLIDLEGTPLAVQQLVITACAEYIMTNLDNTILIVPEARQMIPEDTRTPVKMAVENITARGAKIGNYVWLDSQHMTGVDLDVLRNVDLWFFGYQTVDREKERAAKMLRRATGEKIKPEDIAGLTVGQFYLVRHGKDVQKVYVCPEWMLPSEAHKVAMGTLPIERVMAKAPKKVVHVDDEERKKYDKMVSDLSDEVQRLRKALEAEQTLRKQAEERAADRFALKDFPPAPETHKAKWQRERVLPPEPVRAAVEAGILGEGEVRAIVRDEIAKAGPFGVREVPPARAILSAFSHDALDRVKGRVASLNAAQKKMLAYISAKGTGLKAGAIIMATMGTDSGPYRDLWKGVVATTGMIREDSAGRFYYEGKEFVATEFAGRYDATEADVAAVLAAIENEFAHMVVGE